MKARNKDPRPKFDATYALSSGGTSSGGKSNTYYKNIEKNTFKIPGVTSSAFGVLTLSKRLHSSLGSQRKGGKYLAASGLVGTTSTINIDVINVRTGGAAADFGDLSNNRRDYPASGATCSIGLICGGYDVDAAAITDSIDRIDFATNSDATSFGVLASANRNAGSYANSLYIYAAMGIDGTPTAQTGYQRRCFKSGAATETITNLFVEQTKINSSVFVCNENSAFRVGGIDSTNYYDGLEFMCLRNATSAALSATLAVASGGASGASSQTRGMYMKGNTGTLLYPSTSYYMDYKTKSTVTLFVSAAGVSRGQVSGYGCG